MVLPLFPPSSFTLESSGGGRQYSGGGDIIVDPGTPWSLFREDEVDDGRHVSSGWHGHSYSRLSLRPEGEGRTVTVLPWTGVGPSLFGRFTVLRPFYVSECYTVCLTGPKVVFSEQYSS